MMNTCCGDIDPAIVVYLVEHCGMTVREVDDLMNKQVTALHAVPQL
jgi:acetate kinase